MSSQNLKIRYYKLGVLSLYDFKFMRVLKSNKVLAQCDLGSWKEVKNFYLSPPSWKSRSRKGEVTSHWTRGINILWQTFFSLFLLIVHFLAKLSFSAALLLLLLLRSRTSVDMDGTLKFVNYKVGETQNPYTFIETKYFFNSFCENTFLCI